MKLTTEERKDLGQKIKKARKEKKLSQEQLANLLGYKVGTISKYEQGYRTPDIGALTKIAEVLNCEVSYFLRANEFMNDVYDHQDGFAPYVDWLRAVRLPLKFPKYDNGYGFESTAMIVEIDGDKFDIAGQMHDIMTMSKEHFKLLVTHLGEEV